MRQVPEGRRERATTASSERSSASRSRRWYRLRGARAQAANVKATRRWSGRICWKLCRHHRQAAIKVDAKDLVPRDAKKSLEQLRAEMQKHWERLAPKLDLEALVAPSDGIANREEQEDDVAPFPVALFDGGID